MKNGATKGGGFARLCHLHCLLPRERSACSIVQEIVARGSVGESGDEMVDGERELGFRREIGVGLRAHVGDSSSVRGDRLRARLHMRSELGAI